MPSSNQTKAMSTSSAVPTTPSVNALSGATANAAQDSRNMTLESFVACLVVSASVFVIELLSFLLLRSKFTQI